MAVVDDYGHNPTEIRAALETARERANGRVVALYVPHVVERTRHLHRELGDALALADVAIVTDFVGRRDPLARGRLRTDGPRRRPDPTRRVWAPSLDDAARLALAVVRPGDLVVTLGVGEPWRAARAIADALPDRCGGSVMEIESGFPLSRLTTIGTGGRRRARASRDAAELDGGGRLGGRARARRS